jgi:hypothetical protein
VSRRASVWAKRLSAAIGALALFLGTVAAGEIIVPRSFREFDDATWRMKLHIIRYHVYDTDFIWAAVSFGAAWLTVGMMVVCSAWILWIVVSRWEAWGQEERKRR